MKTSQVWPGSLSKYFYLHFLSRLSESSEIFVNRVEWYTKKVNKIPVKADTDDRHLARKFITWEGKDFVKNFQFLLFSNVWCVFLISFFPFVLLSQVDGYARLFGIFKEVRMLVTSDSLEMYLTTEVNKSFKINVHVTTNYSSDRNETQFNATVVFDNGLSKVRGYSLKLYFQ